MALRRRVSMTTMRCCTAATAAAAAGLTLLRSISFSALSSVPVINCADPKFRAAIGHFSSSAVLQQGTALLHSASRTTAASAMGLLEPPGDEAAAVPPEELLQVLIAQLRTELMHDGQQLSSNDGAAKKAADNAPTVVKSSDGGGAFAPFTRMDEKHSFSVQPLAVDGNDDAPDDALTGDAAAHHPPMDSMDTDLSNLLRHLDEQSEPFTRKPPPKSSEPLYVRRCRKLLRDYTSSASQEHKNMRQRQPSPSLNFVQSVLVPSLAAVGYPRTVEQIAPLLAGPGVTEKFILNCINTLSSNTQRETAGLFVAQRTNGTSSNRSSGGASASASTVMAAWTDSAFRQRILPLIPLSTGVHITQYLARALQWNLFFSEEHHDSSPHPLLLYLSKFTRHRHRNEEGAEVEPSERLRDHIVVDEQRLLVARGSMFHPNTVEIATLLLHHADCLCCDDVQLPWREQRSLPHAARRNFHLMRRRVRR